MRAFYFNALAILMLATTITGCVDAVPAAPAGDDVLELGREVYVGNCASCHGTQGQGGRGPNIAGATMSEKYPDVADQIAIVRDGQNDMPPFDSKLSDDQIAAVVEFSREVLE